MSHDSLAELRNPRFDTQTHALPLLAREPEIMHHYYADLLRASFFLSPQRPENFFGKD
jgi:hypothetical protein